MKIFQRWIEGSTIRSKERSKEFVYTLVNPDTQRPRFPYQISVYPGQNTLNNEVWINCELAKIRVEFQNYWVETDSFFEALDTAIEIAEKFEKLGDWEKVYNQI